MNYLKIISLSFALLLFGCGEPDKDTISNVDNPEVVAIEFFNALYNEKNIKKKHLWFLIKELLSQYRCSHKCSYR